MTYRGEGSLGLASIGERGVARLPPKGQMTNSTYKAKIALDFFRVRFGRLINE